MNKKLDEIGTVLNEAKLELSNLIIEYKELTDKLNIDDDNRFLASIARKAIEVQDLNDKWYDAEYAEFMCQANEEDRLEASGFNDIS
jgi:hypothetical protein